MTPAPWLRPPGAGVIRAGTVPPSLTRKRPWRTASWTWPASGTWSKPSPGRVVSSDDVEEPDEGEHRRAGSDDQALVGQESWQVGGDEHHLEAADEETKRQQPE